jgi:hypothetical protein
MALGSYRKSFLDELLNADDIEKLELPKRSKSVRFIDNEKDQALKSSSSSSEIGEKFKSLNDEDKSNKKSSWLGLNENGLEKNTTKLTKSIKLSDQKDRFNQVKNEIGEIKHDLENETNEQVSIMEDSWLNIKRKIQDTKKVESDLDTQGVFIKDTLKSEIIPNLNSNLEAVSESVSNQALLLKAKVHFSFYLFLSLTKDSI